MTLLALSVDDYALICHTSDQMLIHPNKEKSTYIVPVKSPRVLVISDLTTRLTINSNPANSHRARCYDLKLKIPWENQQDMHSINNTLVIQLEFSVLHLTYELHCENYHFPEDTA
jgi:hypothetical protein